MDNGPELWDAILAKFPGAVIAGGAVRDYLLGVPPKDIDVFIDESLVSHLYRNGLDPHPDAEEYIGFDSEVLFVGQTAAFAPFIVDVVAMDHPVDGAELVADFDFGITRCWYDAEGLHDTFEAHHDREKGRITLLNDSRRERALKRFARFNQRAGGAYTLVEPE